jgi:hypothetical protein
MHIAKCRSRRSSRRLNATNVRTDAGGIAGALAAAIDASKVPQNARGAVTGLERVAVAALQLARNALVTAVSGAAEIGAEAVAATVSGPGGRRRGRVSGGRGHRHDAPGSAESHVVSERRAPDARARAFAGSNPVRLAQAISGAGRD